MPLNIVFPFLIGGVSGMVATALIQPIDTFKVQIQIVSEQIGKKKLKFRQILEQIRKREGLRVLYRGLDSAILRQLFYTSARVGSYNFAIQSMKRNNHMPTNLEKIAVSMISGVIGALIGNPFDVALIRRQASVNSGKNIYRNTWHAFSSIVTTEGIKSLWTGIDITILRVVLINIGQLAARDIIAQNLRKLNLSKAVQDNLSSLLASILTSIISLPADNIKVKIQKQLPENPQYSGIFDCLRQSIRNEGVRRLWVGFPIYLIRGAPHSFVLIRTQLYLTDLLKNY